MDANCKKEEFVLAHISDLHFSSGAALKNSNHSHSIYLLKGIEKISKGFANVDRLVLSGDISNCGDSDSLCRAYDWLFKKFTIGRGKDIGLELDQKKVGIVPGNHDAWNSKNDSGNLKERRQKSLSNYNNVFINHRISEREPAYYDWIEKQGCGIYIVYLDSCFLGEQRDDEDNLVKIPYVSDIARGKLSIEQSELLLEWHDKGMDGKLDNYQDPGTYIDKEKFANSLKILVMHHYLFEPRNRKSDYFMRVKQRDVVFKNIALSDFDVLFCGHKHIASFVPHTYGRHMDSRATSRYLLNYFRRILGIHSYPMQYVDDSGRRFSKPFTNMLNILAKMFKKKDVPINNSQIDELAEILADGLENPKELKNRVKQFIASNGSAGAELLSKAELNEIQKRISVKLSVPERKKLRGVAVEISKIAKSLKSRSFLQVMSGSSGKYIGKPDSDRSFNIYRIKPTANGWDFKSESHHWIYEDKIFDENPVNHSHPFPRKMQKHV